MATVRGLPSPPISPITGPGGLLNRDWLIFINNLLQFIANKNLYGLAADRPAADTVYPGTVYFETDTNLQWFSTGSAWVAYSGPTGVEVDAAGALDGDGTVGDPLLVRVDGNSVVINASNNLDAIVRKTTTVLTNAEVLALPTTAKQLLAAPGAGFWYRILAITYVGECTAGAYTNIDATYADIRLDYSGGRTYIAGYVVDDSTATPVVTDLTGLLGTAGQQMVPSQMYLEDTLAGATGGYVHFNGATAVADIENRALMLAGENNGSGNWTGGNAANSLTVTVYYAKEAI